MTAAGRCAQAGAARRARAVTGAAVPLFAMALLCFGPAPARCGTEQFSTFHTASQEEDDESLLDHVLTEHPRPWRDEWERAPMGLRTAQGCLTSGQWFIQTELKVGSPLGRSARFGVDLRQSETDISSYQYVDFTFRFPTAIGTTGAMFRPLFDKSRQDFALMWETGSDTSSFDSQVVFTFEDMFNNLWAWRQTRVGNESEPYLRHPYEPAFKLRGRGDTWRAELFGQYLTPSRKIVSSLIAAFPNREATLWGTLAVASLEAKLLGTTCELRGWNQQARSTDQPVDFSTGANGNWRRQWSLEAGLARPLAPRFGAELRGIYQSRDETWAPPLGPGVFAGIDRLVQLDTRWEATRTFHVRTGLLYDRIHIVNNGYFPNGTYGTRKESRAYIGLEARFGRVTVEGVEGIELDHEPYDVWFVHDKGFLHLQTTF
jgi:hypothetical protein